MEDCVKMNNLDKSEDVFKIASFIGKALYGIANNRPFTADDAKDAVEAMTSIAKISTERTFHSERDKTEMIEMFNIICEVGKVAIDYTDNNQIEVD